MRPHNLIAVGATLAIICGGVFTYTGVHDAPAAKIARLTHRDHQRAIRLAQHPITTTHATTTLHAISHSATATTHAISHSTTTTHAITHATTTPHATTRVAWNPTLPNEVATISIPALGVSAPVLAETPVNGLLTIPPDVHNVGWDEQTPTPGQPGVTLLAGHVNWVGQGEGALGAIGQLVPGDTVTVNWQGHKTTWRITTKPVLSPNTVDHPWLFSNQGSPRLALVTCGGPFKEIPGVGGSYADNVIVQAVLVG
jgi:sortase (surface protein transpeptidase)